VVTAIVGVACRCSVRGRESGWGRAMKGEGLLGFCRPCVLACVCLCVCQWGTVYSPQRNSTCTCLQTASYRAAVCNTTRPPIFTAALFQFQHILAHRSMPAAQCTPPTSTATQYCSFVPLIQCQQLIRFSVL